MPAQQISEDSRTKLPFDPGVRMSRILWRLVVGTALSSCSNPTGPTDDFELPPPDTSLDPARVSIGDLIAPTCTGLDHLRRADEWALVDVYFSRDGPQDGPTSNDISLITSHGGRVLYSFNVPAVRARITLSRIPALVDDGYWIWVRDVPDASRYDVPSPAVIYAWPLSRFVLDIAPIEDLGGKVTQISHDEGGYVDGFRATLPDRSIPILREWPNVGLTNVWNSLLCTV